MRLVLHIGQRHGMHQLQLVLAPAQQPLAQPAATYTCHSETQNITWISIKFEMPSPRSSVQLAARNVTKQSKRWQGLFRQQAALYTGPQRDSPAQPKSQGDHSLRAAEPKNSDRGALEGVQQVDGAGAVLGQEAGVRSFQAGPDTLQVAAGAVHQHLGPTGF